MSVQPEWIVGGVLVALALLGVAFALGRRTAAASGRVRELESRLEVAAQERERIEGELRGYRERVAEHFSETSQRLHELTVQYRSVYDHLAKGASELCPESFEKLEGGLGLDALPEESPRARGDGGLDASAPLAGASPASREAAEAQGDADEGAAARGDADEEAEAERERTAAPDAEEEAATRPDTR